MKNWLKLSLLVAATGFMMSNNIIIDNSKSAFDARINTYKYECREMIKPFRYEGSRVTYFVRGKDNQVKSVQAYLILDTEYRFAFSGKECFSKVSIKVYDSNSDSKRVLLKEIKNIKGKNMMISSSEMTHIFHRKVSKDERLRTVYIEYEIEEGATDRNEAIIMVVGYKD